MADVAFLVYSGEKQAGGLFYFEGREMKAGIRTDGHRFIIDQNTGAITMDGQELKCVRMACWEWGADNVPVLTLEFIACNVEVVPVQDDTASK